MGCISNQHYVNGNPFFPLAHLLSFFISLSTYLSPFPPSPVSHPREFALDATLVRQMAELGAEQADHIRIDAFDKEKYFERLVRWLPFLNT